MNCTVDNLPELKRLTRNRNLYKSNDTLIVKMPSELLAPGEPMFQLASLESGKNEGNEWPANHIMNTFFRHHHENEVSSRPNKPITNNFPATYTFKKTEQPVALLPTPVIPLPFDYRQIPQSSSNFPNKNKSSNFRRNGRSQYRNKTNYRGRAHDSKRRHEPLPEPRLDHNPYLQQDYVPQHNTMDNAFHYHQSQMYDQDSFRSGRPSNYNMHGVQEGNNFPNNPNYYRGAYTGSHKMGRSRNWQSNK